MAGAADLAAPLQANLPARLLATLNRGAMHAAAAVEIPDGLRAAALPAGAVLMLLAALARMASQASLRQVGLAVAVVGAVGLLLWACQPWLLAMGNYNLIVFFVVLIGACVAGGIPI